MFGEERLPLSTKASNTSIPAEDRRVSVPGEERLPYWTYGDLGMMVTGFGFILNIHARMPAWDTPMNLLKMAGLPKVNSLSSWSETPGRININSR